jgi:hypothetical protein
VKRILAVALASIAMLTGIVAPANAGTFEDGHHQTFVVNNALDYTVFMEWDTAYNSVGTSSTQPRFMWSDYCCGVGIHKNFKSVRVVFKTAAGTVRGDHVYNCVQDSTEVVFYSCPTTGPFPGSDFSNIRLSDGPRVYLGFYSGTNRTGSLISEGTYAYK